MSAEEQKRVNFGRFGMTRADLMYHCQRGTPSSYPSPLCRVEMCGLRYDSGCSFEESLFAGRPLPTCLLSNQGQQKLRSR